jgi:hypothetical protein
MNQLNYRLRDKIKEFLFKIMSLWFIYCVINR